MAPWGVAELRRLGLLDTLTAAGGIFTARHIPYDENTSEDAALARQLDLSKVLPDVPGPLCMGHPAMCAALKPYRRPAWCGDLARCRRRAH